MRSLIAVIPCLLLGPFASPTSPSITLSPSSARTGAVVIIHGTQFPPGEIVALYIDQPNPYVYVEQPPGLRAGADGTINVSIKWPGSSYDVSHAVDPSRPGVHTVCGDTGYPGSSQAVAVKACTQFTVIGPSPTPTQPVAQDQGPSLPVPVIVAAIVIVLVLGIGGQVWLQRQSKT